MRRTPAWKKVATLFFVGFAILALLSFFLFRTASGSAVLFAIAEATSKGQASIRNESQSPIVSYEFSGGGELRSNDPVPTWTTKTYDFDVRKAGNGGLNLSVTLSSGKTFHSNAHYFGNLTVVTFVVTDEGIEELVDSPGYL